MRRAIIILLSLAAFVLASDVEVSKDIIVNDALRELDISTQIAWSATTFEIENGGASSVNYFVHATPAADESLLSFIDATVDGKSAKVQKATVRGQSNEFVFYKVDFPSAVASKGKAKVVVTEYYTHKLSPHPTHIAQAESQYVEYNGNAYIPCPYTMKRSKTTVALSAGKMESFTKVAPSDHADAKVTYGAYDNIAPLTLKPIRIHYENNSPFIVIRKMERVIEVSHWGNIAVEEYIEIEHVGAKLKNSFSRYDYQRDQRQDKQPSVAGFKTILPASARDVYYRDEIGNISTSHMRVREDSVEVAMRPRFPLFGGWKTNYIIGYNVPSYEYMYVKGNNYALKMRFLDHVYDNMVVDEVNLKVILPERVKDIKLKTPYDVKKMPEQTHYTYLDYVGRPVISARKTNSVEKHIQNFEIHYTFDRTSMIYEPFMLVVSFYILFMLVIFYVRLDFTISPDEASESRQKAQSYIERTADAHSARITAYMSWINALTKYTENKDMNVLTTRRKRAENDAKTLTQDITDLQPNVKAINPETCDKLNEVQRLDRQMLEMLTAHSQKTEAYVTGKLPKQQYIDSEKVFRQKFDELRDKCDGVVYSL